MFAVADDGAESGEPLVAYPLAGNHLMDTKTLRRTYRIRGLDRVLYTRPPQWPEGTFEQTQEDEGRLILHNNAIAAAAEVAPAMALMDLQAERFRLAVSRRTGCPLAMRLERSEEPDFGSSDVVRLASTAAFGDRVEVTVQPSDPPEQMEQLSEAAARWVATLAETRAFSDFPDEVIKRLQLLIEELIDDYGALLDARQRTQAQEVGLVRNFVSHPFCDKPKVCDFIRANLPSAVIATQPKLKVRFDRTRIEHLNFVGRWEPIARELVHILLNAAIRSLPA